MKILIFGASGMLGHTLYLELKKYHDVIGVCRSKRWSPDLVPGVDISNFEQVNELIQKHKPDYILNAVGIIKQLDASKDKLQSIEINSYWPHKLCELAKKNNARVIHFSTDCVFSGDKGNYTEEDLTDSRDTYGLTKLLGEVEYEHSLTLRTSIIGHELESKVSLIDWFLSQSSECKGYTKAIYSGFPTITVARFLNEHIFKSWVSGLYHFSSVPISKFDLLQLVAEVYNKEIKIIPSEDLKIDRSLNSDRLRQKLNYNPPRWNELVGEMRAFYKENELLYKDKK